MARTILVVSALALGCGAAADPATTTPAQNLPANAAEPAPVAAAAPRCPDQQALEKRITELEVELALLRAEPKGGQPTGEWRPSRPTPDPAAVYAVPIDGAPSVGPASAWVTVVIGYEFACPYSNKVRETLAELRKHYKDDLRIVYKHFIVHPQHATVPALAACAAAKQGKFAQMYERIYTDGFDAGRDLSRDNMIRIARKLKLKIRRFEKDMDGEACAERVRTDQKELAAVGQGGTPTFYINGRYLSGARPIDQFQALIDEELAKAKASNITARDYYAHVLQTGKSQLDPPATP